jgi:hypothetical protein
VARAGVSKGKFAECGEDELLEAAEIVVAIGEVELLALGWPA